MIHIIILGKYALKFDATLANVEDSRVTTMYLENILIISILRDSTVEKRSTTSKLWTNYYFMRAIHFV